MAFARIIKRSATAVLPLANKPIAPMMPLLSVVEKSSLSPVNQYRAFTSVSRTDTIVSAINAAKEHAEEGFPFPYKFRAGYPKSHWWGLTEIELTRKFEGETIDVEALYYKVFMVFMMTVKISRKNGLRLEFECGGNYPSRFEIECLEVKSAHGILSEGKHKFSTLDENIQKELIEYLDERGINMSLIEFFRDCKRKDESKPNKLWLEKLEDFFVKK